MTSQLTSAKEGISMKKNQVVPQPGNPEGREVAQRLRTVRGMCVALFVFSICFAATGAIAQQFGRERGQGGSGGQDTALLSLDPGPRVGFTATGNSTYPNNPGDPIS